MSRGPGSSAGEGPADPIDRASRLRRRLEQPAATDSYRLGRTLLGMMFLVALDASNFFDRGGPARYVLLLIPLAAILLIRLRYKSTLVRRMSFPDKVLLVFML